MRSKCYWLFGPLDPLISRKRRHAASKVTYNERYEKNVPMPSRGGS